MHSPPLGGGTVADENGYSILTFTQADAGKTYTYTLIASNVAGVSKPATFTITVKWNGAAIGVVTPPVVTPPVVTPPVVTPPVVTPPVVTPPVVTPPVVTPPVVTPPITGTNGTGRQKSARELYREGRTPGGALKAIIPRRATASDQSPANRTNPRMALRLGLGRGGGGNSTNAVTNGPPAGNAAPVVPVGGAVPAVPVPVGNVGN